MKNVQQISTMLPIGRKDDSSVCTTSFRPGALLITLNGLSDLKSLNTWKLNKNSIVYFYASQQVYVKIIVLL